MFQKQKIAYYISFDMNRKILCLPMIAKNIIPSNLADPVNTETQTNLKRNF